MFACLFCSLSAMFSGRSLLPSGVLPGNAATLPVYKRSDLHKIAVTHKKIWTLVKYFKTVMIVEWGIHFTRVVMEMYALLIFVV